MGRIFLSHVEEDEVTMQQVGRGLEAAGYTTWYFERDVLPGTSYLIQITRAIEESDAIVLIISPEALGSDQVTKEVVGAFERGKDFFPVLVNITPSELKKQQPEWRHALGGTAMIMADPANFSITIESIIKGLKSKNIQAEATGQPRSTPTSHIMPAMETGDGERKNITVMFASVSGFSSLSEKMDAEEVTELMNECFSIMKKCIDEHDGTINKFIGDSAMILFGAPRAQEDAPHRALDAALEMRKRLQVFNGAGNPHEDLNIHIGINTGTVITGKAGGDRREDYTVTGETVNLASHMQDSAGRGEILVSESTYRMTEGYFDFKDLGPVNLKCTEQPVHSYSLIGPREVRSRVAASLMKGLTPFKGRAMEMTRLMDCYKKTGEGEGQVIGIMGEPGMGKSRLVLEFIQSLPAGTYINLSGSCQHFGDAIPYLPIVEIISDYLDLKDGDNETVIREKAAAKISQLEGIPETVIPPLHEFLSLKVEDESYSKLDGKQRRDKVFDSIRLLLFAESRAKPLVIVVDDLHWIDHTSEEFLGYLVNSIAATRIMLVLLYRPEYIHSWSKKTYYSQIQLGHLPGDTSKDLIQAILDDGDVDSDINDLIIATTSGNPLFMEELTHSLIENCSIEKSGGKYILKSQPSEIRIPDTIQGIIADRLDRLELNLKKILQTASVIGREFAFRVLEAVAALKDDLKGSLATLQDLEFIYEEAVFPELEYIFKHALTREVAYNTILLKKRRETHELVAQSIEKIYAERIGEFYELLAYHYSKSGNSRKACLYYWLSANKALTKYSNDEALNFYKEALRMLDEEPENDEIRIEKMHLLMSFMAPLYLLGFPEGSLEILQRGEALALEISRPMALTAIYHSLSIYHTYKGDLSTAIAYAEKSFNEAEKSGETELMLQNANSLCYAYYTKGNMMKTADLSRRAMKLFEEHNIDKSLSWGRINVYEVLCTMLGGSLTILGQLEEAKIYLDKVIHSSNESASIIHRIICYNFLSQISWFSGDAPGMISHALEMIKLCEAGDVRGFHGLALSMVGVGYFIQGEYKKAREYGEKGLAVQKESGMNINTAWCYWFLSTILIDDPDAVHRTEECATEALNYAKGIGAKQLEAASYIMIGAIIGKADSSRKDEAIQSIQLGISMFEDMKLLPSVAMGYLYLGELLADAGRNIEARESLAKAESLFREVGQIPRSYWISRIQETLGRLR